MKATLVLYIEIEAPPSRILETMSDLVKHQNGFIAGNEHYYKAQLVHVETLDHGDLEDRS